MPTDIEIYCDCIDRVQARRTGNRLVARRSEFVSMGGFSFAGQNTSI